MTEEQSEQSRENEKLLRAALRSQIRANEAAGKRVDEQTKRLAGL